MNKFLYNLFAIWIILSLGLASCTSTHPGERSLGDEPCEGREIVIIDYPLALAKVSRPSPESMMQYRSVPENIRKKIMDTYLRTYARLSVNGKDWDKYKEVLHFTDDYLEKSGYYRELQKKGYVPASCHPFDRFILFDSEYYPYMCLDIYQTLRNDPSYLNGVGVKGFSRMLTYDSQYDSNCRKVICRFPEHFLGEIGIHSMKAPPLDESEDLSEPAKISYRIELHRVYYTNQDGIIPLSSYH